MAKDAPDGVKLITITTIVEHEPIIMLPASETLVWETYKIEAEYPNYRDVVDYTVPNGKVLKLTSIELESANYDKALWKVKIGPTELFTDKQFPRAYSPPIPEINLAAGTNILIRATGNATGVFNVWADVIGKLVG